ncbi:hypothetical protein RvY_01304-2 [Ramazzottius varieornatus]|uniref:Ubiquitin fusion degradation protein 1 homolog n=1 Tax=Ramazzottius varieornatus TaxID=947166 RepID=A0A1D1UMZ5_RAMVA|nr:hypothetical protein RvY_01304-2 [Ramazzottius varieornatus]
MFAFEDVMNQMGMGHMFPGRGFTREYRCYSTAMLPNGTRPDVEKGGKIILPPSALHVLSQMNVQFPMLFKLRNLAHSGRTTHGGVLEFIADEGFMYMPSWMMRNLFVDEGEIVQVQSVSLPVATYSKFQPQSVDFLDITDPRAVLESTLRGVACLTVGDIIAIEYNSKIFELLVQETKPAEAVSIIETDMQVDFDAPVGYKEPERLPRKQEIEEDEPMMVDADALPSASKFNPFEGSGQRLGGHKKKTGQKDIVNSLVETMKKKVDVTTLGQRGVPNYDWKPGRTITVVRTSSTKPIGTTARRSQRDRITNGFNRSIDLWCIRSTLPRPVFAILPRPPSLLEVFTHTTISRDGTTEAKQVVWITDSNRNIARRTVIEGFAPKLIQPGHEQKSGPEPQYPQRPQQE